LLLQEDLEPLELGNLSLQGLMGGAINQSH
jgi:hypothetical protein